jgi:hypothetical protein
MQFPSDLQGMERAMVSSSSGDSRTLKLALRVPEDLSIVKFTMTWLASGPLQTCQVTREDVPPPRQLSVEELYSAHAQFGENVARWAEAKMNQQVGDGECWTLAKQAIEQGTQGAAMSSIGYIHGDLIYQQIATQRGLVREEIRRGDIMQFTEAKFESRSPAGMSYASAGNPGHTSVVSGVSGNVIYVVHQNSGGVKRVQQGTYTLEDMVAGEVKVYRVVWREWAGELTT